MIASINSIWYSIGHVMEWTFENVLVVISNPLNWFLFIFSLGAMAFWLNLQGKYNAEAKKNNTIK